MEKAIRDELNTFYAVVRRLNKEFANPNRTATDDEINQAIREVNATIQILLKADLEAQGIDFDPNGPKLDECEHCGRALQYVPDHECWGTQAEAAELERNGDYKEDMALEPYGNENEPPMI